MDLETVEAAAFGRSLRGIGLNLIVRDVAREAAFLVSVFAITAHRVSADFAILGHGGDLMQLHADATYRANPLPALLPEAGPRGGGVEIRLYGVDPDAATARARAGDFGAVILQPPTDKPHGLREAYILCENGYAWVPGRALPE